MLFSDDDNDILKVDNYVDDDSIIGIENVIHWNGNKQDIINSFS
jgi:hypothetical protein